MSKRFKIRAKAPHGAVRTYHVKRKEVKQLQATLERMGWKCGVAELLPIAK
jgi:hypothetical protein